MLPRFRNGARVGESVFAYGFPLAGLLSSSGNFTSGIITANAGLNDDSAKLQFSAPVQPGNSGGALFDQFGSVVGIVVATVDAWAVANSTKSLPQNINFAIKASAAISFLEAHGVTADTLAIPRVLAPADIADRAREASVHVVCS
jgi:S1-C subfamily serine protease